MSRCGAAAQTTLSPSQYGSNKRSLGARQVRPRLWFSFLGFCKIVSFGSVIIAMLFWIDRNGSAGIAAAVHHLLKLVHTVAEKCDRSHKSETVAQKWNCHRKVRQSPNFAVVSPFSATVTLFCDSLTFVRQIHFSATVSLLCDRFTFLRQCGQGFTRLPTLITDISWSFLETHLFSVIAHTAHCRLFHDDVTCYIKWCFTLFHLLSLWPPQAKCGVGTDSAKLMYGTSAVALLDYWWHYLLRFFIFVLCCYFRRGPGGKFVPPVLNRNANDDDGW